MQKKPGSSDEKHAAKIREESKMKCQFIDNDDFFEEYLLDRISDTERQVFAGHLSECKACSENLAQQEKILAGIREIGRAEIKAEIKQQAELADSGKLNWGAATRITALAFVLILTPTMYYVYKNPVQLVSTPPADMAFAPLTEKVEMMDEAFEDLSSLEAEFSDELALILTEEEIIKETKKSKTQTASNIPGRAKNRTDLNLQKPQLSKQAPELQMQLKKKIAKEDSKNEQRGDLDLDETLEIDALSLEVSDDVSPILLENELIPATLNSMSGAAVRSEEQDSDISYKLSSSKYMRKEQKNILSRIVRLKGREVALRLIIEPSTAAGQNIKWPDEFPVYVTRPDSNRIILKGKLPVFQNISSADFSARGISENKIEIRFGEIAIYRIKIDSADSKAIRVD